MSRPARGGAPPHEVRLIGGRWKRSKLPVPDRPGLRPTPDRVRETLFNWLGQDLSGWRCLDAFAGSGALGFECASRGAALVQLIERDAAQARSLRASAQRLGGSDVIRVASADALAWLRTHTERFELVLLDPPFDGQLLAGAIALAAPHVADGGFLYVESGAALPAPPAGFEPYRAAAAGAVQHGLWRRSYTRADLPPNESDT